MSLFWILCLAFYSCGCRAWWPVVARRLKQELKQERTEALRMPNSGARVGLYAKHSVLTRQWSVFLARIWKVAAESVVCAGRGKPPQLLTALRLSVMFEASRGKEAKSGT